MWVRSCASRWKPGRNTFEGRIVRINPQVDLASRTFQVEALVPNSQRRLKPGSFAQANILTRMESGAVFIPEPALYSFAGVNKVFVVRDGKAAEIAVDVDKSQRDSEGHIRVVRGLKGDEVVIASGLNRIATGVPVVVEPAR
jgi:membrane fusion protein (multidrug efflux system)